jgi:hypothetical protein
MYNITESQRQQLVEALTGAYTFIRDGVEFGYIKDTTHPDWRHTLRETRAAESILRSLPEGKLPPLDFRIDGDVLRWDGNRGCREATTAEKAMWSRLSAQPAQQPLSDEREAFFAWVEDCGCDTDGAWSAWQARAKLAAAPPVAQPPREQKPQEPRNG